MSRCRRQPKPCAAHVGPVPVPAPTLLQQAPLLVRLEREVEDEYRPQMLARLHDKVAAQEEALHGKAPRCPVDGRAMKSRGRKPCSIVTRYGELELRPGTYRCPTKDCGQHHRPLMETLGVEGGQVSGALLRLLALLGVVVPYELAAQLAYLFFGTSVSSMTVWWAVQRLGAAAEQYAQQQARFFADPNHKQESGVQGPAAVVLGVDGCMLGMQVRKERRRHEPNQTLPPLPKVEEGHFREVKTGVLLLPQERVETSPGRRSVLRRALVTCLGNADEIFERLWSKLCELGWMGPATVVVIVGDGAEWIWKRATMFQNRCEILDFWHALECAWKFARLRYGEGSQQADRFMDRLASELRGGQLKEVLARLQTLVTDNAEQQEALGTLLRYYTDNAARMRYDEYLRLGYGIGSGAVESSHKQVVHARLRQAGMRWSERGAQHLLALRVLLLNGQWGLVDRLALPRAA